MNELLLFVNFGLLVLPFVANAVESKPIHSVDIPEYGIGFQIPTEAHSGQEGIWLPGLTAVASQAAHEFGFLPKYSAKYLGGVYYRTRLRFLMLTPQATMGKLAARRNGWTNAPSIDLYPFTENSASNLLRAVEMLYSQSRIQWRSIRLIEIEGQRGLEMTGPFLINDKEEFFHEIRAIPRPSSRVLIIHSGYFDMRQNEMNGQRAVVSNIVQSVRFSK